MTEKPKAKTALALAETFILMVVFQAAKLLSEKIIRPLVPDEIFWQRMVTAAVMVLLAAAVYAYAQLRKTPLSVFPHPFGKRYIVFTCVALALLASSPQNFIGGYQAILLAIYGSIITPVYEELLFRGYFWNRLNKTLNKEMYTFLWSIVLFTVWHLGYMLPQLLSGEWIAVAWKLVAGAGYGTVLGFVRMKTKNCYSTMLVHGVLNIFML
ncbi:MAG: CPBP family intramembrane glutamic endopeptidase [Clostridiaceae bacterium]|nr:CPBP family intramembrane glutamic endopeptidase [Clostridiaceae bacterium]